MINKVYYENKYLNEYESVLTKVLTKDEKSYIKLADYIFYPQGGGQKGDKGRLIIDGEEYKIVNTIRDFENINDILIAVDREVNEKMIGKEVKCFLDYDYRLKQMKLHTALHLLHYAIECVVKGKVTYPIVSTIEDGFAFNKYQEESFSIEYMDEVIALFNNLITKEFKIVTYPSDEDNNYRFWQINDYFIPCGGLHVDKACDVGKIAIKVTNKKGHITIKLILE